MTKAQQIREFFKQGLANLDIAQRVECREEYVRAVRQRTDEHGNSIWSPAMVKHMPRQLARQRERYRAEAEYRTSAAARAAKSKAKRRAEARAS